MTIQSSSIALKPNPQVVMTELGDGTGVLLHLDTKFYYTLNGSAMTVWKALASKSAPQAPHFTTQLASALVSTYEVEETVATDDVARIIRDLSAEGLLVQA